MQFGKNEKVNFSSVRTLPQPQVSLPKLSPKPQVSLPQPTPKPPVTQPTLPLLPKAHNSNEVIWILSSSILLGSLVTYLLL